MYTQRKNVLLFTLYTRRNAISEILLPFFQISAQKYPKKYYVKKKFVIKIIKNLTRARLLTPVAIPLDFPLQLCCPRVN